MAQYHPIGEKVRADQLINLNKREVELIKMIRKVEGSEYIPLMHKMWKHYYSQMELLKIDTSFVKSKQL